MSQRLLAALLTALAPLLVVGGFLGSLDQVVKDPSTGEGRLAAAGRVLNGKTVRGNAKTAIDRQLASAPVKLLVLGNSVANRNVIPSVVAAPLSLGEAEVALVSIPGSSAAHWYAILKNRVYANGHRPPVVLVVAWAQTMLMVDPWSEAAATDLTVQLEEDEPVISRKISHTNVRWQVMEAKRTMLRDATLNLVRDAAIDLFLPAGELVNDRAMRRVFHPSNIDPDLHGSSLPVTQARQVLDIDSLPTVPESFVPDLVELATANHSVLVLVRPPWSPQASPENQDLVPEASIRDLRRLVESAGHRYVDLSSTPLTASLYADHAHLGDEGAETLSRLLGEILHDMALFGSSDAEAFYRAPAPVGVALPTHAVPPPEVNTGLLDGEWVLPGEAIVARFEEGWEHPPGYFQVHVVAEQYGAGAPPTFRLSDAPLPIKATQVADRTLMRTLFRDDPPKGPWSIELEVPADGAPVLVNGLRVGRGPGSRELIGDLSAFLVKTWELLGNLEIRDGLVQHSVSRTDFAGPPPAVPATGPRVFAGKPSRGAFQVPLMAWMADTETIHYTPLGLRCSPLRVLQDGVPLRASETCASVMDRPRGRSCHSPDRLLFGSTDGTPVVGGPHRYEVVLDPSRACWGARWLYPGDRFAIDVEPNVLARFRDGVRALRVRLVRPTGRRGKVTVRALAAGERVLEGTLDPTREAPGGFEVPFERTLWPDDDQVRVEVEGDDGFTLVASLELVGWLPGLAR